VREILILNSMSPTILRWAGVYKELHISGAIGCQSNG
jgi:hypothetical protein